MKDSIHQAILSFTDSERFEQEAVIQMLWSGYGEILRLRCIYPENHESKTFIAKYVSLPDVTNHPRGWDTDISHQRKVRSYQVESHWYQHFAKYCDEQCKVPTCVGALEDGQEFVMVLEDLDAAGFSKRLTRAGEKDIAVCVQWLANFHAQFLKDQFAVKGVNPADASFLHGLWPVGTYWHLQTRPDEFDALPNGDLKRFASTIDKALSSCRWQTIVHGDAKLANFCFSDDGKRVAAVDFQYVGGSCGMKDLACFISSCLTEEECENNESEILNLYFDSLRLALIRLNKNIPFDALETEWRTMYKYAWADFYRFLQGWSPGHWKMHAYSEKMVAQTIKQLKKA